MTARVHCIILNWRTAEMTLKVVEAARVAMAGIDGAITVVDNDSQDGSFERLSQALADARSGAVPVRVMQSGRNGGFGAGNNFAIRAGLPGGERAEFVLVLNSDAFPARDAIAALLGYMQERPNVGFAGSRIIDPDGTVHVTAFRFPSIPGEFEAAARIGPISRLLHRHVLPLPLLKQSGPVGWLAGASVMMRQDMLDEVGLFDERFFLYFEETDLMLRAARMGWEAHQVIESEVTHIGSVSTGMRQWQRVPVYWFDSRWHYFAKNHGRGHAALATLARMAGVALHLLRMTLTRGKSGDPPYFFRDLMRHGLRKSIRPEQ